MAVVFCSRSAASCPSWSSASRARATPPGRCASPPSPWRRCCCSQPRLLSSASARARRASRALSSSRCSPLVAVHELADEPDVGAIAAIGAAVIALQIGLRELVFFFWQEGGEDRVPPSIVLSAARSSCCSPASASRRWCWKAARLARRRGKPADPLGLRGRGRHAGAADARGLITVRTAIDQRLARVPRLGSHHGDPSLLLTLLPLLPWSPPCCWGWGWCCPRSKRSTSVFTPAPRAPAWSESRSAGRPGAGARRDRRCSPSPRTRSASASTSRAAPTPRAWSSASRCAPSPCATTTARCTSCPTARSAPCATLARLGNREVQPAAADRRRQREDPQADQEGRRGDGGRPGSRAGHAGAAQGQALPHRSGVKIFHKFRTAPGNQFDIRAQAYKRIEAAPRKMEIRLTESRTVVSG